MQVQVQVTEVPAPRDHLVAVKAAAATCCLRLVRMLQSISAATHLKHTMREQGVGAIVS
jgi:hypothetical protein